MKDAILVSRQHPATSLLLTLHCILWGNCWWYSDAFTSGANCLDLTGEGMSTDSPK